MLVDVGLIVIIFDLRGVFFMYVKIGEVVVSIVKVDIFIFNIYYDFRGINKIW